MPEVLAAAEERVRKNTASRTCCGAFCAVSWRFFALYVLILGALLTLVVGTPFITNVPEGDRTRNSESGPGPRETVIMVGIPMLIVFGMLQALFVASGGVGSNPRPVDRMEQELDQITVEQSSAATTDAIKIQVQCFHHRRSGLLGDGEPEKVVSYENKRYLTLGPYQRLVVGATEELATHPVTHLEFWKRRLDSLRTFGNYETRDAFIACWRDLSEQGKGRDEHVSMTWEVVASHHRPFLPEWATTVRDCGHVGQEFLVVSDEVWPKLKWFRNSRLVKFALFGCAYPYTLYLHRLAGKVPFEIHEPMCLSGTNSLSSNSSAVAKPKSDPSAPKSEPAGHASTPSRSKRVAAAAAVQDVELGDAAAAVKFAQGPKPPAPQAPRADGMTL